jgi:hypothetical protein
MGKPGPESAANLPHLFFQHRQPGTQGLTHGAVFAPIGSYIKTFAFVYEAPFA